MKVSMQYVFVLKCICIVLYCITDKADEVTVVISL